MMPPNKDHESLLLKLAQFNILSTDEEFVGKRDIEFVLEGLNLNSKVPGTSYLEKYNNNDIIGDSLLHLAFKDNNLDLFNLLLCKGADFNSKNKEGDTVLHRAFHDICFDYHFFKWNTNLTNRHDKFIVPILFAHVKYRNTSNPSDSNGLTHFHIACAINDVEAVEFFLHSGVKINEAIQYVTSKKYFRGHTPLHLAAEFGCAQVTEILLKHGANTILENDKGQTPLHVAVKRKIESELPRGVEINEKVLNLLLNHNSCPKFRNPFAISALKDSCETESYLTREVDVNQAMSMDSQIWPGYTALHFAAHVNVDTVKLLIRHGANIEAKEANGVTPFEMCIDRYRVEDILDIVQLVPSWKDIVLSDGTTKLTDLLGVFKNIDEISNFLRKSKDNLKLFVPLGSPLWPGFTVLHIAVLLTEREFCKTDYERKENSKKKSFNPNLAIITECLKQDADVTVKDQRNWTPVHLAFRLKKHLTLRLLLQHHHRIQNFVDESNLSHLHIACSEEDSDLVKKLLWNDANVNIVYQGDSPASCVYPRWTPLHIAIYKTKSQIVKLLLQFGADIYAPDMHGYTAVHHLMHCKAPKSLSQIVFNVKNLLDFSIEDIGLSYLHVACVANNVDAVKQLLDLGADVNKVIVCKEDDRERYPKVLCDSYNGSTPLHLVYENYFSTRLDVVRLLIERGADLLAKNKNNVIPLFKILENGTYEYLKVVIEALKRNVDLQKRIERETGMSMLHVACQRADFDLVKELLDSGVNVNAQIHENSTLWPKSTGLHLLLQGDEDLSGDDDDVNDIINMLLDHNADVTLVNGEGETPLHVIFRKLCVEKVSSELDNVILLLKAHKDFEVNPTSIEGLSHFHIACHILEVDVVENFLEHGVDVNMKVDAFYESSRIAAISPLRLAVNTPRNVLETDATNLHLKFAQLKIVDLLIKHGAEVDVEDVFGDMPAHNIARCTFSKENLLQRLANGGANVNAHNVLGEAPLEILLKENTVTLNEVRCFVTSGCRLNAFNKVTGKGYIALADDVLLRSDMLHLLFGALVNSSDSMKVDELKRTAIHNVVSTDKVENSQAKYVELLDIFMMYGCDIDDQDVFGRTALHLAAQFRNESAVKGLLGAGADINITDRDGKTPFAYVFEPCSRCSNRKDEGHDQYSHPGLFEIFMGQIKKMEFCDIYVNPSNEVLLNKALTRFNSDSFANDLNEILIEVGQIANMKIESYKLSAADFVWATVAVIDYPMMSLAKRKAIDQFFRANKDQFQRKLKQIAGILQLQYRQALLRKKIINTAVESLRVLAGCRLPDICSHIVLRSLKNFELQNLIASTFENDVTS